MSDKKAYDAFLEELYGILEGKADVSNEISMYLEDSLKEKPDFCDHEVMVAVARSRSASYEHCIQAIRRISEKHGVDSGPFKGAVTDE